MRRLLPLFVLACHAPAGEVGPHVADTDATDTDPAPKAPERVFTFAILADPHVTTDGDHAQRLRDAVAWVEREKTSKAIELVLLAGDIAWSDGFPIVLDAMAPLTVPWVPIVGDNEVQLGSEQAYDDAMTPHYDALAEVLPEWVRLPTPTADASLGRDAWYQCFAFTWKGVTFVGFDVASRVLNPLDGEFADLHDVPGGPMPFVLDRLADRRDGPDEDVVLLTHNPLLWTAGGLDPDEQATWLEALAPYGDRVALALGGHLHFDAEFPAADGVPYDVVLTDALWDDAPRVRLVDVWSDGRTFTYVHHTEAIE
jgi:hypothetical protein